MALMRRERYGFPEMMRRFFDGDWEEGWLRVEEFREDDNLVIRVEMPGIDPDKEVEISVQGDMMHIQAEKEEKSEHKDKQGYRSEFRYGSFVRDLLVPEGTKAEDAKAVYRDGVLEIRVPLAVAPETPATKIPIEHG
jgi:HSP20 family protein